MRSTTHGAGTGSTGSTGDAGSAGGTARDGGTGATDAAVPDGCVLAVTGCVGAEGATSLSLLLARTLAERHSSVALVDLDPTGGMSTYLEEDLGPGLRWADLPRDETCYRPHQLAQALTHWRGTVVLTGDTRGGVQLPQERATVQAVVRALTQACDVVVLDLPRTAAAPPGSHVLLVTSCTLRSAVAARVLAPRLQADSGNEVRLVVRRTGQDVDEDYLVWSTGCQVLGRMPTDRSVAQRAARGDDPTRGRGSARRAARALADALSDALAASVPALQPPALRVTGARPGRAPGSSSEPARGVTPAPVPAAD